jgi:hypothetical protein
MQAHIVDSSDVREESNSGTPYAEASAACRHTRRCRRNPGRIPHDHPLRPHQPCSTETRDGALHRPRATTHQHLQLIRPRAVLLGEPGERLQVAAAQYLVSCMAGRAGHPRHTTPRSERHPVQTSSHGVLPHSFLSSRRGPSPFSDGQPRTGHHRPQDSSRDSPSSTPDNRRPSPAGTSNNAPQRHPTYQHAAAAPPTESQPRLDSPAR